MSSIYIFPTYALDTNPQLDVMVLDMLCDQIKFNMADKVPDNTRIWCSLFSGLLAKIIDLMTNPPDASRFNTDLLADEVFELVVLLKKLPGILLTLYIFIYNMYVCTRFYF